MTLATIDVGTNTTLLLVAARDRRSRCWTNAPRSPAWDGASAGRRAGRRGIERTLAVLRDFAALRGVTMPHRRLGTEALRRARNAADFLRRRPRSRRTVEVIDGQREAALTYRAVVASFPTSAGPLVVVDIGGGSTEIVLATDGAVGFRTSLPLGSVRLTEAFVHDDPPTRGDRRPSPPRSTPPSRMCRFRPGPPRWSASPARSRRWRRWRRSWQPTTRRASTATGCPAPSSRPRDRPPRRGDAGGARADAGPGPAARGRHPRWRPDPRPHRRAAGAADVRVSDRGIRWGLFHELSGT